MNETTLPNQITYEIISKQIIIYFSHPLFPTLHFYLSFILLFFFFQLLVTSLSSFHYHRNKDSRHTVFIQLFILILYIYILTMTHTTLHYTQNNECIIYYNILQQLLVYVYTTYTTPHDVSISIQINRSTLHYTTNMQYHIILLEV